MGDISSRLIIRGEVQNRADITGYLSNRVTLNGSVQASKNPSADLFEGDYEVVPDRVPQTLATAKKFVTKDIVIKEVPHYVVTNEAGGETFIIGA